MPTSAIPQYSILVANFSRPTQSHVFGSDTANMAPTKVRTGFTFQCIQTLGFALDHRSSPYGPAYSLITKTWLARMDPFGGTPPPTGDVTVSDNTFAGASASLFVGPYELISSRDYVVGGAPGVTAVNIAAAISNLPGYTGTPAGAVVTVNGPPGQVGLRFEAAYRGGNQNFTFTYVAEPS